MRMKWVKLLSHTGFVHAILGYYNQYYLHWLNSMWLSGYSIEIAIVAGSPDLIRK